MMRFRNYIYLLFAAIDTDLQLCLWFAVLQLYRLVSFKFSKKSKKISFWDIEKCVLLSDNLKNSSGKFVTTAD